MIKTYNTILDFLLIGFSLIAIIGAAIYKVYALNFFGVFVSLLLVAVAFFIIAYFYRKFNKKSHYTNSEDKYSNLINPKKSQGKIWLYSYIALFFYCLAILWSAQTSNSIISPWQSVPVYFFFFYGLTTLLLLINIRQGTKASVLLISLHYFLTFAVALIVYKLGYGFDSFIHQATERLINEQGLVEPKPLYYLGHYSLVIILHKLTIIPIVWLDKILVPLMAALFLPSTFYKFLNHWFKDNIKSNLTVCLWLALPLSIFIVSTPQNLAWLLLLIAILRGLTCANHIDLLLVYLVSLAALSIHPIAGIPALLFAVLLSIYHSDLGRIRYLHYSLVAFLLATALPAAFYYLENNNGTNTGSGQASQDILINFSFKNFSQENFILNFIYLYAFNIVWIFATLTMIGLIIAYKHRQHCRVLSIYLLSTLALLASYFLTRLLPFDFLISYERDDYANRILTTAILFLLPFISLVFYGTINLLMSKKRSIQIIFTLFFVSISLVALYTTYPRLDNYHNSHGYSLSANDIKAVHWIENSSESDYIVLANQQVSAAALREFGFSKYYHKNIFYYPIPTGGQLYRLYMDMVYQKAEASTALSALDLTGAKEAYFVINKYWWAFDKIIDEAKQEADSWHEIDDGEVVIFKFTRK